MKRSKAVAKAMGRIRRRRGLSLNGISQRLGSHLSYWSMYETGKRRPSLVLLVRMRRMIDLTDDEVLEILNAADEDEPGQTAKESQ